MPARQFYLPPRARNIDRSTEESLRAIEDYLQSVREVFDGKLVNGAIIGGTQLGADGMPVQTGGLQSGNYVAGGAGWRVQDNGQAEFQGGTFRGTILGKSPSMTRTLVASVTDRAGGTYTLGYDTLDTETGDPGIIEYVAPALKVNRTGMYMFTAGVEGNMDLNGLFALTIRGMGPGTPTTTSGVRLAGQSIFASGIFLTNCTAVVRQNAGDQAFVVISAGQQFDITRIRSTFFACNYLSDI